jgi:Uma2 family endonuclease
MLAERLMTTEEFREFQQRPENANQTFELIYGVIFKMPSPVAVHNLTVMLVAYAFGKFAEETDLDVYIFGDNLDFELDEGIVIKPDVAFIFAERLPELPKYPTIAPDIAVEVISPSNSEAEMIEKAELYIKYGSRLVWLMYPDSRTVRACRPNGDGSLNIRTYRAEDGLDADGVLEGFRVTVSELFPKKK